MDSTYTQFRVQGMAHFGQLLVVGILQRRRNIFKSALNKNVTFLGLESDSRLIDVGPIELGKIDCLWKSE